MKDCGGVCVSIDDPLTGCGAASCDPCALANATATCGGGVCAVDTCDPGHVDCDGAISPGCEHSLATVTNTRCGGCSNDCTLQGADTGFTCATASLVCRCTSAPQCRVGNIGDGQYDCNSAGLCVCDGDECNPGETCLRDPPSASICACNGGSACVPGTVCCQSPAMCADLQNDSGNCGACGWVCPAGTSCQAGVCT
jgi:hypothetical protein